jgi:DNA-binding MarR family transcriptional regulator
VIVVAIHYGRLLRILHWCTDQTMTHALETMELTSAQGRIMGFLAHRKEPPCPKDIEEEFQLSHPTVSGLLGRLEKKDFIEILPDEHDRRCKRIHVRPRGKECMENMYQVILNNETRLVAGFTEEEQALFADFLKRAITNMGGNHCRRPTHKEDEET